ncbi:4-hydroxybenzoate 3-monooxygenase [Streptomyces sp. NBC_01190]|uniref:4-hydroxybenzoate 3-monooxygenase n=1 Tax=Streptomyces sp. NBC_01190 TaxID=2903767 RepID=UPI0038650597|nr:4-hydroxybenzoate 3-monooxygenase [Streptomyces sp. NBC_01190]
MSIRTQVGIIGAGPAGLTLANILSAEGIDCVVVEKRSRSHVENRARAGLVEPRTVAALDRYGLADGLLAHGVPHRSCEFRRDGERFSLPYGMLTDGRQHLVYPQQRLVADLIAAREAAGGILHFSHPAVSLGVADLPAGGKITVESAASGERIDIECDVIAGCDGFHGISRRAVPEKRLRPVVKQHDSAWLAVLADAPPSTHEIVYALHNEGYAGHMLRTPTISRYYLQCPLGDAAEQWSDDRIWSALDRRLSAPDWKLNTGEITQRSVLDMRSYMSSRMDFGNLFLVGDAAHIITPAGGKGMNLAIADAVELASSLLAYFAGDERRIRSYSALRIADTWQCQEFSHWLLQLLHTPAPEAGDHSFMSSLQSARLDRLRSHPSYATAFAESYVGPAH